MKYAIMVPFDNDGYIFVTKLKDEPYDLEPVLYNNYDDAKKAASVWGKFAKVVKYEHVDD